ncbi:FtsX-like permease family protein [Mucilaginibacter rubeus]|uniref:ABC transporter permease n=1 Tax=Mucilaginibacter rubeus TaxID=2027860 RepID=A0AAE6JE58_9SPHI|nr:MULTISPECIES: ABC transporter permease [Mucilaginibacter]QEM03958.1 FtsX-like permease family protein [Mucilaginibacter rubeus]QEM16567.1 FtsX-like permease family protein [Mucilaginibacter gossypii]QTE40660.1 ABC transporter permease [Mucilaginibacter rubeus]QTE47262.1 ABC transporter permease [Mucilaginibacter rubeus]QTE58655.1 ABC transporter permease [Mucilaginibacter rubeus]
MNPDIFHVNLSHVAAMATLFSGFTLALLLAFAKRQGQRANLLLSVALTVIVLKTGGLSPFFLPALGPLLYLYVRQITSPNLKFNRNDLLHFCPMLVTYWIPGWLVLISVVIYLYLAHRLIQQFYNRLQPTIMDRSRLTFRPLEKTIHLLGLLCVLWLFNDALSFIVAFVVIGVAAEVMLKLDDGTEMTMPLTDRYIAREKSRRLKEAVASNRFYEDAELTLTTLAVKLNIHPHDLSRIINVGMGKNFNDFINEFRVRETARKMRDPAHAHLTLLGIAYESGFNSQRTFNRVFKEMTGKTPAEYKNSLKKELPNDKLAILSHLQPVILRSGSPPNWASVILNRNYMFKNYLKIALRTLAKQKTLSFINIFGLSVGIGCFNLFMLYAINEFSFDGFHKNAANTYLVLDKNGKENVKALAGVIYTPMPLGPAMKQELPGVENYVRYIQPYETFIKIKNDARRENIAYADSSFFNVFSFKFKYGNAKSAISGLHSMVLTEETANRLFGKTNAIGQSFQVKIGDVFETFTVTAIAENPPSNSSFQYSMLANFDCFGNTKSGKMGAHDWWMNIFVTVVQLKPGSKLANNNKLLANFWHRHFPDAGTGGYNLVPIKDVHTSPALMGIKVPPVDPKSIWILLSIVAGVLLIACINFTTLSIGRSANRAKEIGVRKVIGGTKKALVVQFLTESFLLAVFSTLIGLALAYLLLPYFNQLSGRELSFSFKQFPQLTGLIAGLILIVALLSGCYPALVLSGFNTADALKAKIKLGGANFFTKALVTFQFVLSAVLIVSAIIIMQQLHYMESRNPGFNKENVIVAQTFGVPDTKHLFPLFKQEVSEHPGVSDLTSADNGLGEHEGTGFTDFNYQGKPVNTKQFHIDPDYIPTLGMQLLVGRNFNPTIASDTVNAIIINESMMKELGWKPENCIGRQLEGYGEPGFKDPTVIGVVRDFNYEPLTDRVAPALFHQFERSRESLNIFYVRLRPGNPSKALAAINSAWKKIAPDYPLEYNFLDEDINRFYKAETRLGNIISWVGGIAIFLACLGLLGLSALAVANRTKEIGIRKVLGASVSVIIGLISKDFLRLVVLALFISTPITWWLMNKWLQAYAYRITIEWWFFGVGCLAIISVALLTVYFQAIKAAVGKPVKSLRTE